MALDRLIYNLLDCKSRTMDGFHMEMRLLLNKNCCSEKITDLMDDNVTIYRQICPFMINHHH